MGEFFHEVVNNDLFQDYKYIPVVLFYFVICLNKAQI